jgi:hypothetical protein
MPQDAPSLDLPPAIATYFTAGNGAALAAAFSADAVVQDEGREMRGHDAILTWRRETTAKYQPRFVPLATTEQDGTIIVTAEVSGTFPGSPVKLDFTFTLHDGKIATLEIH